MSDDALMRPADRREETNFDKVWRYYYDAPEITLTDEQEKLRKRWDHVWKLMGGFLTATQIVKKHLKENPGITERTAWMDLRNAKALYGDPASQNRMAERMRLNNWIVRGLKKSEAGEDWGAYARLIDIYRKNNLLDKDDKETLADLLEHFQPHTFVFTTKDPAELQREADELMKGVPTVDGDYTIVDDEV
tara:strand:- start:29996 stop:30568 length:573 start_codon:yes stop_codon:yes gene_type:complete